MTSTIIPNFTLNNGRKMPAVGMGYVVHVCIIVCFVLRYNCRCWMGEPGGGEAVERMCRNALKVCRSTVLAELC